MIPLNHVWGVESACISRDSKFVATSGVDKTLKIWEVKSGRLLFDKIITRIRDIKYSNDGNYLICSTTDSIFKIDQQGHIVYGIFTKNSFFNEFILSRDNKYIVAICLDSLVQVYDFKTGNLVRKILTKQNFINSISLSNNNEFLISCGSTNAKIWKIRDGKEFIQLNTGQRAVLNASFSDDNKLVVASCHDSTVRVWAIANGILKNTINLASELSRFKDHHTFQENGILARKVLFLENDMKLLVYTNTNIIVYNIKSKSSAFFIDASTDTFSSFDISNDKRMVAVTTFDDTIRIWNLMEYRFIKAIAVGNAVHQCKFTPDNSMLFTSSRDEHPPTFFSIDTWSKVSELKGHVTGIIGHDLSIDRKYFAQLSTHEIKVWNLNDLTLVNSYRLQKSSFKDLLISTNNKYLIVSSENELILWDFLSDSIIKKISLGGGSLDLSNLSSDGKYLSIIETSEHLLNGLSTYTKNVILYNLEKFKIDFEYVDSSGRLPNTDYSYDGHYFLFEKFYKSMLGVYLPEIEIVDLTNMQPSSTLQNIKLTSLHKTFDQTNKHFYTYLSDSLKVWDLEKGYLDTVIYTGSSGDLGTFSDDGKYLLLINYSSSTAKIWQTDSSRYITKSLNLPVQASLFSRFFFSSDKKYLLVQDYSEEVFIIDIALNKIKTQFPASSSLSNIIFFSSDNKSIITCSEETLITKWSLEDGRLICNLIGLDSTDYLVLDSVGRYDGTINARKLLYYVCNNETIDLDQLKQLSWEPNLAAKITGLSKELITAKPIDEINICNSLPLIEQVDNKLFDNYSFKIISRSEGVGLILLYVGNKQVKSYDPLHLKKSHDYYQLTIYKEDIKDYLIPGETNTIWIKATTANNEIFSKGPQITILPGNSKISTPNLYSISVGICKYKGLAGKPLNTLHYASQDAYDLEQAVTASARKLLNEDSIHEHVFSFIYNSNLDSITHWPLKKNIKKAFDSIANQASASDILLVFLSGHGILNNRKFYYLTADASNLNIDGIENEVAISDEELNLWMRNIKAQKQVLILDACNSGQVINSLITRKDIPADQQRALEQLRSMTGTYMLAAAASGESAYEMSLYGQGILTYSLLLGMKSGKGLRDNKYVDITSWFQFAAANVNKLTADIEERQHPQISENGSFQVGIVDKTISDKIKLSTRKPLFKRSIFLNDELFIDNLKIAPLIDNRLYEMSFQGKESPLMYYQDMNGDEVFSINGRYKITTLNNIEGQIKLIKGSTQLLSISLNTSIDNLNDYINEVLNKVIKKIEQ